jgi:ferric-dicitrate binding protein FerR (iron transport regulator)
MNEQDKHSLIIKYLAGEANDDEQKQLALWRKENPANDSLFLHSETIWNEARPQTIDLQTDAAWQKVRKQIGSAKTLRLSFSGKYVAMAAAVVFIAAIWVYYSVSGSSVQTYYTSAHQIKTITLPDNSTVTLNENSKLTFEPWSDNERTVKLQGEAFFEISPNPQKPFIISTSRTSTRVLGTSFIVKAYEHDTQDILHVFTGKVLFKSMGSGKEVIAIANDEAIAGNSGNVSMDENADINAFAWQTHQLLFSNTRMSEVIHTLEKTFNVTIKCENENILRCHFTGEFKDAKLEQVLQVICKTLDLGYTRKANQILLTGSGCK